MGYWPQCGIDICNDVNIVFKFIGRTVGLFVGYWHFDYENKSTIEVVSLEFCSLICSFLYADGSDESSSEIPANAEKEVITHSMGSS